MGDHTEISWCDHSHNPWFGCSKVGPACDFCYAEHLMDHRLGKVEWGGDRVRTSEKNRREPLKWNAQAAARGRRETVFCLSLGDIWDNAVPPPWRHELFETIERTPWLVWLLLSKRIGNAVKMCDGTAGFRHPLPPNAALGATMIDQEEWDRDAPKLEYAKETLGALFSFASIEPMLGPTDMRGRLPDWVISGGESGAHARPSHPDWFRSLRDQCAAAGVPYHHKQWGEWAPGEAFGAIEDGPITGRGGNVRDWMKRYVVCADRADRLDGHSFTQHATNLVYRVGKKRAGRLLDGKLHDALPELGAPR